MVSAKIAFYTIGEDSLPSTRFRILQYLPALHDAGITARCFSLPGTTGGKIKQLIGLFRQGIIRWHQLGKAAQYDVIVVQKGLTPWRSRGMLNRLLAARKPYIMDIDDAVYAATPIRLPFYLRWLQYDDEPVELIRHAGHVIAGNTYLAGFAGRYGTEVTVIPTPIDTALYRAKNKSTEEKITVGWSGSSATNFYLNLLIPVLNALAKKYDFRLLIISNSKKNIRLGDMTGFKTEFITWNRDTETRDLKKIDIGVMPLIDDEWSRGKCGLKALQYMALDIPAVCSPVGVNVEIIQDGKNGFLAATNEEWVAKLSALMKDGELRKQIGAQARKTVEDRYSISANTPLFLNVLQQLSSSAKQCAVTGRR